MTLSYYQWDIERVKSGARQRALVWQTDKLYGKAVSDAVITYEDLYHLYMHSWSVIDCL